MRRLMALAAVLLAGCATDRSTGSGAIGLDRPQYFAQGSRQLAVESAGASYDRALQAALAHRMLNTDAVTTGRIVAIANRLIAQVGHFRPEALGWTWEVNVMSNGVPNATCGAGGKIWVYTGLLDRWQPSDDELAAVIGHEIGHALRDHAAEKISIRQRNGAVAQGLSGALSAGLLLATGINLAGTVDEASALGADAFGNLPNSREQEFESDRIGLELMARAGYDPNAAATLWRKVARSGESNPGSFWSTHPADQTRLDQLTAAEPGVQALFIAAKP